jgi:hypothetical protein
MNKTHLQSVISSSRFRVSGSRSPGGDTTNPVKSIVVKPAANRHERRAFAAQWRKLNKRIAKACK